MSFIGTPPGTLELAVTYTRIRALAAPAVLLSSVAAAGLLGVQDATTPLKIFVAGGWVGAGKRGCLREASFLH